MAARAMAEVGLPSFARVAMETASLVLPLYRSRYRKLQFKQPQPLAILCFMRYEDGTFLEVEVRRVDTDCKLTRNPVRLSG